MLQEVALTQRRTQSAITVEDISRTGAGVLVDDTLHLTIGDEVVLSLEGIGDILARVQRIADGKIGLVFLKELS